MIMILSAGYSRKAVDKINTFLVVFLPLFSSFFLSLLLPLFVSLFVSRLFWRCSHYFWRSHLICGHTKSYRVCKGKMKMGIFGHKIFEVAKKRQKNVTKKIVKLFVEDFSKLKNCQKTAGDGGCLCGANDDPSARNFFEHTSTNLALFWPLFLSFIFICHFLGV